MNGKKGKNRYIITEFLHLPVISMVKPVAKQLACFIPYQYDAKAERNENLSQEQEKKRRFIEDNPRFRNVQQQGFGNVPLRQKDISFPYFYSRVCYFEEHNSPESMESEKLRNGIVNIMGITDLLMKINHPISDGVKDKVIGELDCKSVKYMVAKLLLYMVRGNENNWPTDAECEEKYFENGGNVSFPFLFMPNIHMDLWQYMETFMEPVYEGIHKAKSVWILCREKDMEYIGLKWDDFLQNNKGNWLYSLLGNIENMDPGNEQDRADKHVCIIISESKKRFLDKETASRMSRKCLEIRRIPDIMPYSAIVIKYGNPEKDYLRVDFGFLHHIGIDQHPGTYIFRELHKELFGYFEEVFRFLWSNRAVPVETWRCIRGNDRE